MRLRLLPFALVLPLVLAGCGEDETPGALPELTATPTATAEATGSEAPVEAPDDPGAFARSYIEEIHRAYVTRDPERLTELSSPSCETCNRYIGTVEALLEDDATVGDSYQVEVTEVIAPSVDADAPTASVIVMLRVGDLVISDASGAELFREEGSEQLVQSVDLVRSDGVWRVAAVTNQ